MTDPLRGVLAMAGCATIWGLSGIYYKALVTVPALEVIAHRTLWSMVLFGLLIALQGRLRSVLREARAPQILRKLTLSAAMITVNWTGFVFAVHNGWALEASLGYYIFPLMAVVLGMILLGERLHPLQAIAVCLATISVLTLAIGLGATPWISLLLAATFSVYGLVKRGLEMGPVASVFIEVLIVAPIFGLYLIWVHSSGVGAFGQDMTISLLLIGAGPMTAIPLILFSYATRRLTFATVGLMQYINPSLLFLVAVFLFGEAFTRWHAIALPLIWLALALYSLSSFRGRAQR